MEDAASRKDAEVNELMAARRTLQERNDILKKSVAELESFRRSIISMVEHGSSVSGKDTKGGGGRPPTANDDSDRLSSSSTITSHQDPRAETYLETGISPGLLEDTRSFFAKQGCDGGIVAGDCTSIVADQSLNLNINSFDYSLSSPPFEDTNRAGVDRMAQSAAPAAYLQDSGIISDVAFSIADLDVSMSVAPARRSPVPADWAPRTRSFESECSSDVELFSPLNAKGQNRARDGDALELTPSAKPKRMQSGSAQALPPSCPATAQRRQASRPPSSAAVAAAAAAAARPDASAIYRQIREACTAEEFKAFAAEIAAFNASKSTPEQTLARIGKIVRDKVLFEHMRNLIYSALSDHP
ncbi:hypothetical protein HK405_009550 [Cladochytrium tenue]|nr:hypothetical protein HK405_009550 [Cladochytrium tenue]